MPQLKKIEYRFGGICTFKSSACYFSMQNRNDKGWKTIFGCYVGVNAFGKINLGSEALAKAEQAKETGGEAQAGILIGHRPQDILLLAISTYHQIFRVVYKCALFQKRVLRYARLCF